jgi:hypothetical protein
MVVPQGKIWQVTCGNASWPQYKICANRVEDAKFHYAEDQYWTWTQIKVTSTKLEVWSRGVIDGDKIKSMFRLTVNKEALAEEVEEEEESSLWLLYLIYGCLLVALIVL